MDLLEEFTLLGVVLIFFFLIAVLKDKGVFHWDAAGAAFISMHAGVGWPAWMVLQECL